ncbi:MAG: hypothetical protein RIR26_2258 [Pseudomonadota bacterium]|jgi:hypothetical protein
MNAVSVDSFINSSWTFLNAFYAQRPNLNIFDFIQYAQHNSPRVLIDDSSQSDACFIAIEFPSVFKSDDTVLQRDRVQTLSVICEEVSHFFHLVHAAEREMPLSALQLEALGEIDRFVCFLHWNAFFPALSLPQGIDNCSDAVELLFEKRSFNTSREELYIEAESLAFFHLRRAFSHCWTHRYFDATRFDNRAREYIFSLTELRSDSRLSA